MNAIVAPVDYVRVSVFETLTGVTDRAVEGMIRTGEWREGIQYRRKKGHIYVSLSGYHAWVEDRQAA